MSIFKEPADLDSKDFKMKILILHIHRQTSLLTISRNERREFVDSIYRGYSPIIGEVGKTACLCHLKMIIKDPNFCKVHNELEKSLIV